MLLTGDAAKWYLTGKSEARKGHFPRWPDFVPVEHRHVYALGWRNGAADAAPSVPHRPSVRKR